MKVEHRCFAIAQYDSSGPRYELLVIILKRCVHAWCKSANTRLRSKFFQKKCSFINCDIFTWYADVHRYPDPPANVVNACSASRDLEQSSWSWAYQILSCLRVLWRAEQYTCACCARVLGMSNRTHVRVRRLEGFPLCTSQPGKRLYRVFKAIVAICCEMKMVYVREDDNVQHHGSAPCT